MAVILVKFNHFSSYLFCFVCLFRTEALDESILLILTFCPGWWWRLMIPNAAIPVAATRWRLKTWAVFDPCGATKYLKSENKKRIKIKIWVCRLLLNGIYLGFQYCTYLRDLCCREAPMKTDWLCSRGCICVCVCVGVGERERERGAVHVWACLIRIQGNVFAQLSWYWFDWNYVRLNWFTHPI